MANEIFDLNVKEKPMKLFIFVSALFMASLSYAISFNEKPIYDEVESTSVAISTSAWTQIPMSDSDYRLGIEVSNPKTSTAAVVGVISKGTPSEATTIRPIEIEPGENRIIRISSALSLYLLSLHTSAETVHAQEYLSR